MAGQRVREKRTLIKFATQQTTYAEGRGSSTSWQPITAQIGTDDDGSPIITDCFYCEWLGSYGSTAIQQQADGIIRPARVRMPFVQSVYDALLSVDVRIYLYGMTDAAHTFKLASAADNYKNENKMLEFQVELYGVK